MVISVLHVIIWVTNRIRHGLHSKVDGEGDGSLVVSYLVTA